MNNIQISTSEARAIRGLFHTNGWKIYNTVICNAREKARDAMESSLRDDKLKQTQGACLILKELANIEEKIKNILDDNNN